MLYFLSDYTEGAHPKVLERLAETNLISQPGYGEDRFCASARDKIRAACEKPGADVYFLVGGTQTNAVAIASLLNRWEGVIAADTGHISVHEAGAIEFSGHKVLALPGEKGKLAAQTVADYCRAFYADETHEHMPFPGMVYISQPTELGTLYTKAELAALHKVCGDYGMRLFLDGARLGYGLMSPDCDMTLPELCELCDLFYIGGTKVGALCGEALVFPKGDMPEHFATMVKQQGGMLAKGRLLGVQFDALFTEGLYFEIGRHAISLAMKLKAAFREKGYSLFADSPTNQQFVILTAEQLARLRQHAAFEIWAPLPDGRTAVRFVTSWATREEDVDALIALL
ncbi:MAG: low specificity L-threonine aldolase [Oscillospiraceae bacterium]|nr:low specificity L-threonine aldolase [Oscillospiraceae bacterium]